MPDITVALALLEKPIAAIFEAATGNTKEYIALLRANNRVRSLYQKLNASQKVKTIWVTDRAVALSSFYFPAKLKTNSGVLQPLSRIDELPANAVVLLGIVGQGKSILLRYLLGKEIRSGLRVPLLIELRRLPPSGLLQYLHDQFDELMETSAHPEIFDLFAKNGRLSFLIDGFDEVEPERTQEVVQDLEALATRYPTSRMIVTSRPNSGIEQSPHFDSIPLAPLSENDFSGFFLKLLPRDRELAQRITSAVLKSPTHVKQLATTPLLATQLTIVYRAIQRIPGDFTEFYDELFSILLVRHDRSKKGWERKRRTKLTDREIQQVFEAYCFKSKAVGVSSVQRGKALELAAAAAASSNLPCDETHFLADIEKVTCLLQEEGGRVEFLHQSVQEFFAARYISTRPESIARDFYAFLLEDGRWQSWDQVLRFLNQIDAYRASQYFFVPALTRTIQFVSPPEGALDVGHLREACAGSIGVMQALQKPDGSPYPKPKYFVHPVSERKLFRQTQIDSKIFEALFGSSGVTQGKWKPMFDQTTHGMYKSYREIAEYCGVQGSLDTALMQALDAINIELGEHQKRVQVYEESKLFMGFHAL